MRSVSSTLDKIATVISGLILLGSLTANGQEGPPKIITDKTVPTPASMGQTKSAEKKILLNDVAPVSTEVAARSAAREKAQSSSKKKSDLSSDTGIDSVLEFHPASPEEQAATNSDAGPTVKRSKKNIHGEAYGGMDSTGRGTHQAGSAVGATSKGGKTSVYVQGEQTRSTQTPQ